MPPRSSLCARNKYKCLARAYKAWHAHPLPTYPGSSGCHSLASLGFCHSTLAFFLICNAAILDISSVPYLKLMCQMAVSKRMSPKWNLGFMIPNGQEMHPTPCPHALSPAQSLAFTLFQRGPSCSSSRPYSHPKTHSA